MMAAILRLWYLAATREAVRGGPLFLTVAIVFAAQGWHTTTGQTTVSIAYPLLLFVVGWVVTIFLPTMLKIGNILESDRLDLLPFTYIGLFFLRAFAGNPARVALAVGTLMWGIVGLASSPAGRDDLLFGALVITVSAAAAIAIGEFFDVAVAARFPTIGYATALAASLLGLQTIVSYDSSYAEIARAVDSRGWSPSTVTWGLTAGASAAALGAVLLWYWRAQSRRRGYDGSRAARHGRRSLPLRMAGFSRAAAPAKVARELALIARLSFFKAFAVVCFGMALVIYAAELPLLVGVSSLPLLVFLHNSHGADIAFGGLDRAALLPLRVPSPNVFRHLTVAAVGLLLWMLAASLSAAAGGSIGITELLVGQAFGIFVVLTGGITGDWISVRRPKAIPLRSILVDGGFVGFYGWLGILAVVLYSATAIVSASAVLDRLTGTGTEVRHELPIAAATIIMGMIYFVFYTVSKGHLWRS